MAIADAEYQLLYIDVGCNGRVSDGGVFGKSTFQYALDNNTLNLPTPQPLPDRQLDVPYVLVADDAFRMQKNLLKPYPGRNLSSGQRIFNYRLSRARRVVENVFGIMTKHFQVLYRPIQLNEHKVKVITLACCALHNFLVTKTTRYVAFSSKVNEDKLHFKQPEKRENNYLHTSVSVSDEVKAIRKEFEEYFMSCTGEIPFQYKVL